MYPFSSKKLGLSDEWSVDPDPKRYTMCHWRGLRENLQDTTCFLPPNMGVSCIKKKNVHQIQWMLNPHICWLWEWWSELKLLGVQDISYLGQTSWYWISVHPYTHTHNAAIAGFKIFKGCQEGAKQNNKAAYGSWRETNNRFDLQ
jgi:hypothetical protein